MSKILSIIWLQYCNTFTNSIQTSTTSTSNHLLILSTGQKRTANIRFANDYSPSR
ncbi:unnamed protein product [Schistosoma curassoni]|uniref:Secreted protein n=1 Tax=Schistosoma curassoni TaxID=6186 RepID=A0A183L3Y4_9TREM|nr:unnamed protein product [Schistosoma curassoni]